jgi:hypothetical protein
MSRGSMSANAAKATPADTVGKTRGGNGLLVCIMVSVVLTVSLLLVLMAFPWNTSRVEALSDADAIRQLHAELPETPVSVRAKSDLLGFVETRSDCYEASRSFGERIRICSSGYTRDILKQVHENARTNAGLGEFMDRIAACPVIYNICRGEEHGSPEMCVERELQCLNYAVDRYRYGSRTGKAFD